MLFRSRLGVLALDVRLVVLDSVVLLRMVLLTLERLHLHSRILPSCEQLRELEARDGDFAVALGASDADAGPIGSLHGMRPEKRPIRPTLADRSIALT